VQSSIAERALDFGRLLDRRAFRLLGPVLIAGVATALFYASVDRNNAWAIVTATAAVALLGAVLTLQYGRMMALEEQAQVRTRQLEAFTDVVTALNSSASLGSALGPAVDRLRTALRADAIAVWLPYADSDGNSVLVEERGLPAPERDQELLETIKRGMGLSGDAVLRCEGSVPGRPGSAHLFTVRMGGDNGHGAYFSVIRWTTPLSEPEAAIVTAIGTDVGNSLRSVRMVSDARKLSDRDPVTGLVNHRSVYQRLHAELERHKQAEKPLSILLMDLDNFKLFNDTYGHGAGDEVLKRVSGVLQRSCREGDVVARYGADEFMVLLPQTPLKEAIRCAERIQGALARERFRCQNSASLPIGFSYGIAVCPDDATDVLELVATADANLYESKSQGGNRITAKGASTTDSTLVYVKGYDLFRAMVTAIDNKDGYTRKHSEEVTEYSVAIARAMELPEEEIQTIQLSGILHDIGKIGVPDAILRKPGKLTDEEFHVMQQHPVFGALIVGSMPGMDQVVLGVRHHHERYDGRGYPDRLAGEQIPLIGRIMAIADAFSAMTTTRPYRKGMTEREALVEIRCGLGTQFDPKLGEVFIRLRETRLADQEQSAAKPRRFRAREEALAAADS
jgi:diguanylate cyclase (GGDEF)-like protein